MLQWYLLNLNHFIDIREDIKQGVYVENLKQEVISNAAEASAVLKLGMSAEEDYHTYLSWYQTTVLY